jgi:hypothetical protein
MEAAPVLVSGSSDIEQKSPTDPATRVASTIFGERTMFKGAVLHIFFKHLRK